MYENDLSKVNVLPLANNVYLELTRLMSKSLDVQ